MNYYVNLFGLEVCAEPVMGRARFEVARRNPRSVELWVGKIYVSINLVKR